MFSMVVRGGARRDRGGALISSSAAPGGPGKITLGTAGAGTICKLSRPGRSGEIPHGNRRVGIIKLDVHVCDGGPERDESWQGGRQTSDGETQSVRVT